MSQSNINIFGYCELVSVGEANITSSLVNFKFISLNKTISNGKEKESYSPKWAADI